MAGNDAASKFAEAMNDSFDALIDTIRAANDRGHRFTTALIEDAQRGQREAIDLATKWMDAPFDFAALSRAIVDAATKAQGRTLDVTRQLFSEMADAQKETRELFQRVTTANRSATESAADVARGLFNRASEAVQTAGRDAARGGDGVTSRTPEPVRAAASRESNGGIS